ncbi:MAG TPA: hypothetical protein VH105_26680 [Burkholderiales bacterium]|jgi:hypothetical protein|nr:hypothetical protein [Burkholderiales bacterium]
MFRQPVIKADRVLQRDANYVAEFANVPLREIVIDITLDAQEQELLSGANLQEYYGTDEAAMLRDVVLSWWERTFTYNLPGTTS